MYNKGFKIRDQQDKKNIMSILFILSKIPGYYEKGGVD